MVVNVMGSDNVGFKAFSLCERYSNHGVIFKTTNSQAEFDIRVGSLGKTEKKIRLP